MTRLAFAGKFGKPGSPPIEAWLAAASKLLGKRLARPMTPRPRDVLEKNWRRVMARGSTCEERSIMGFSRLVKHPTLNIQHPEKDQRPSTKSQDLEFGSFLDVGCW